MLNVIALELMVFVVSLELGGGLYEARVVYPNWNRNVTPDTLKQKLDASGQTLANRRYWPLISPAAMLLGLVNLVLAWHSTSGVREQWLMAASLVLTVRIVSFAYFIPTQMRTLQHPEKIERQQLAKIARTWTTLSPARLPLGLAAWILGVWALTSLR